MAQQSSLVATLAVGLFSLAVTYFAFRTGLGMVDPAASMVPGTVSLARTENQAGFAVLGGAIVLLAVAGLLISMRVFFPKS
jgi:hypothetical protein